MCSARRVRERTWDFHWRITWRASIVKNTSMPLLEIAISQLTSVQVALLGMTTGAGVIVISAAAFTGGYALATSGKIATVTKLLAVKGGEIVKVIFSSAGAAASEITKWSNIFGNIMAPVTSMFK